MRSSRLLSGRALVVLVALVLTGAASAGTIVLVKRGGDDESPSGTRAQGAGHTLQAHPAAGSFEPDETRLRDCRDQRCYEQAFGNLSFRQGPEKALRLFDRLVRTDSAVEAACHRIAHTIGSAALARYQNVGKAFAAGSASCSSGYYHGLLERAFAGVASTDRLATVARDLCRVPTIQKSRYLAYQCIHGLGHGLMIHTGYHMPLSLGICDKLSTQFDQISCTGGVFMENISSSYAIKSRWLRKNDLIYPCNAVKTRHKYYCYIVVTSRILPETGYDWKRTAAICRRSEADWVGECFESFGRDASGFSRQDVGQTIERCRLGAEFTADCLYGAARGMANDYERGGAKRAGALCRTAAPELRPRCFLGIGTILGTITREPQQRQSLCRSVTPAKQLRDCLRGAGERV